MLWNKCHASLASPLHYIPIFMKVLMLGIVISGKRDLTFILMDKRTQPQELT